MKAFALISNIVLPGVGSLLIGRILAGILQFTTWSFGLLLTLGTLGIGGIIGLPLMLIAWVWAIVTAANHGPVDVRVVNTPRD